MFGREWMTLGDGATAALQVCGTPSALDCGLLRTLGETALLLILVLLSVRLLGQVRWFTRGTHSIGWLWRSPAAATALGLSLVLAGIWSGPPSLDSWRTYLAGLALLVLALAAAGELATHMSAATKRLLRGPLLLLLAAVPVALMLRPPPVALMLRPPPDDGAAPLVGVALLLVGGVLVISRALHGAGPKLRFAAMTDPEGRLGAAYATQIESEAHRIAIDTSPKLAWAGRPDVAIVLPSVVGELGGGRLAAVGELLRSIVPDRSYELEGVIHEGTSGITLTLTRGTRLVASTALLEKDYEPAQPVATAGGTARPIPGEGLSDKVGGDLEAFHLCRPAGLWLLFELHRDFFGTFPEGFGTGSWESAAHNLEGQEAALVRDFGHAQAHFLKALDADPENDNAWFNYARSLLLSSEKDTLIRQHEEAIRLLRGVDRRAVLREQGGGGGPLDQARRALSSLASRGARGGRPRTVDVQQAQRAQLRCRHALTAAYLHLYLTRPERRAAVEDLQRSRWAARRLESVVDKVTEQKEPRDQEWKNLVGSMRWTRYSLDLLEPPATSPAERPPAPRKRSHGMGRQVRYNIACALVRLGELDSAVDLLKQDVRAGNLSRSWEVRDPALDALRDHGPFLELQRSVGERVRVPGLADLDVVGRERAGRLAALDPPITDVDGLRRWVATDPRRADEVLGADVGPVVWACDLIHALGRRGLGIRRANLLRGIGVHSLVHLVERAARDEDGEQLRRELMQAPGVRNGSLPTPHTVQCWVREARSGGVLGLPPLANVRTEEGDHTIIPAAPPRA
jgi:tetratricopeptide (TPR) repeat protein